MRSFAPRSRSVVEHRYAMEGERAVVPLRVHAVRELFSYLDPSPVREQDLDDGVEEYIVVAARELPKWPLKLAVHLPADSTEAPRQAEVESSIRSYFAYRRDASARELRDLLADGRHSLVIGLLFLTTCLAARELVAGAMDPGAARHVFEEGLLVCAWVGMWQPIQIFLYEWWPVHRRRRLFERLTGLEVELRVAPA